MFSCETTPRMSVELQCDGSLTYEWLCHGCRWHSDDHFITSTDALFSFPTLHCCEDRRN